MNETDPADYSGNDGADQIYRAPRERHPRFVG